MKLIRFGPPGREKPGLIDASGEMRDLSGEIGDVTPDNLAPAAFARLRALDPDKLPLVSDSPRIGACVAGVGKIVAVGLNYHDHAAESGMKVPSEPVLFMKAVTSLSGPNDNVILPKKATKGDWEVELGIVIGAKAKYVSETDALSYVAGYCLVNDVSERAFQLERGSQWSKGKSADTFCPIGPWLVTTDEINDPHTLALTCEVNGELMQNGSTANTIFSCARIVSYISRFMTLMPGDLIPTGTPAGVGMGRGRFLKPGDVMRLTATGLGEQRQSVVGA
jgi:2-keto-4-pentenoate hydratase/2-oxohepta-3-ene-1,7-dioic acid hydratase in catechol pathway